MIGSSKEVYDLDSLELRKDDKEGRGEDRERHKRKRTRGHANERRTDLSD